MLGNDLYGDNWNSNEFPLPEWAIAHSSGKYMEVGAQLSTRDGRRTGNAFVNAVSHNELAGEPVAEVITDAGWKIVLTEDEMKDTFYPPSYIMNIEEARERFLHVTRGDPPE